MGPWALAPEVQRSKANQIQCSASKSPFRTCWLTDYRWTPSLYLGEFQLTRVKPEYEQRTKLHSSFSSLCVRRRGIISAIHTRFGTHTAPISHFFIVDCDPSDRRKMGNWKCVQCVCCLRWLEQSDQFILYERKGKKWIKLYTGCDRMSVAAAAAAATTLRTRMHVIQSIRLRYRVQTVIISLFSPL